MDIKPDQHASGVTSDGEVWSIARYRTTVVITIDGVSDDNELATPEQAAAEYAHNLRALMNSDDGEVED